MPRFLVSTQRKLRGQVASARDAVREVAGVKVIDDQDPEMITIDASEETAADLKKKLAATHFVDNETRHRLH